MKLGEVQSRLISTYAQHIGYSPEDDGVVNRMEEELHDSIKAAVLSTLTCLRFCCSHRHPSISDIVECKARQDEITDADFQGIESAFAIDRMRIIDGEARTEYDGLVEVVNTEIQIIRAEIDRIES